MATVAITRRKRKVSPKYPSGWAYNVRFRTMGRETKLHDAGTFPKRALAVTRTNLILVELAAGRDPLLAIDALGAPTVERITLLAGYEKYMASRRDVGAAAQRMYGNSREAFVPLLGEFTDPHRLSVDDVQEAVNELERNLSPETVRKYVGVLGLVLAYLDVEPNPAKSDKLKRTQGKTEEYQPATLAEFDAALLHIKAEPVRLLFELVECLGLRIDEALSLQRGDIDFAEGRLRVSKARTKTRSGQRWLPVPGELLDRIAVLVGDGAAHDRRVFNGLTAHHARRVLASACKAAGVRHLKPHGFRHRRISLWVTGLQIDPVRVRYWAGHATAAMSLDVYGHIVVGDDRWRGFWLGEYNKAQRGVAA